MNELLKGLEVGVINIANKPEEKAGEREKSRLVKDLFVRREHTGKLTGRKEERKHIHHVLSRILYFVFSSCLQRKLRQSSVLSCNV